MATTIYFRSAAASTHLGTNNAKLDTNTSGWIALALSTSPGASTVSDSANTVAGTTSGIEITDSGFPAEWISEPLDQDVTISGTITHNVWMHESAMTANVGAQVVIERLDSQGGIVSTVSNSEQGTELGTTNPPTAARNWTNAAPTSTAFLKGDRIRIRVAGNDAGGTMASGNSFTLWYDGPTGGANGDSFVTFTETFGFETTTPAGTQLFLTDVAAPITGTITAKEMWTSRGSGVDGAVIDTTLAWTTPLLWRDPILGLNGIEWYSKQLQAFTLGDLVRCNLRALESSTSAEASIQAELAVCNNDGTNITIWGSGIYNNITGGELTTSEAIHLITISGDDLSVVTGQRLRLRVHLDNKSSGGMNQGHTCTLFYDGTSGGASGDSWIQLSQAIAEFTPTYVIKRNDTKIVTLI